MGARRRGRLLAFCAGALAPRLARTSVAETTVFEVTTVRGAGALAAPVLVDVDAGCLDGAGISRRFGDRCVTLEADALATCAALANCVAVQCLPAAAFSDLPDRVGLDAAGAAVGASAATLALAAAAAAGDPAGGLNAMDFAVNNLYATTQGGQRGRRRRHAATRGERGRRRRAIWKALKRARQREEILRDRNDAPVTGGAASADARYQRRGARDGEVRRSARRRSSTTASTAASASSPRPTRRSRRAPATALCDPNATLVAVGDARRASQRGEHHLLTVTAAKDALDFRALPGAASRAIADAARERTTALVYDAATPAPEWARRLADLGRGELRRPGDLGAPRALAVVPGAALQTCAPACKSEAVRDAIATWDADALIVDESDGSLVGHGNYNWSRATAGPGAGTWKGAASDHAGRADWLAGVGSEDGGAIPLEAPLLPPFPWGS
ncbi:hypothetical protein JL721_10357 [Aureococcus anophagefferens]|nr:hypothetical protein JL721_10357 [Aureococcus anophagefferens]